MKRWVFWAYVASFHLPAVAAAQAGSVGGAGGAGGAAGAAVSGVIVTGGGGGEPVVSPHVLSPRVPVPANGAIPIEGPDLSEPMVHVWRVAGEVVEGTLVRLGTARDSAFFAWRPSQPFQLGTHYVRTASMASTGSSFEIEVVEASARTPPAIEAAPSISGVLMPYARACCTTPIRDEVEPCAVSYEKASVLLDPGLSTTEPAASVHQFLFRARLVTTTPELSSAAVYEPLGLNDPLIIDELADSYCFEVEAIDIASDAVHVYPGQHCIARAGVRVETIRAALSAELLDGDACLQPPPGFEAEWCSANEDDCDGGLDGDCKLYRYACLNGPLPGSWRAAAALVPERNIPLNGPDYPAGEGCAVSRAGEDGTARSFAAAGAMWMLLGLRRARRYQAQPTAPRSVTSNATGDDA